MQKSLRPTIVMLRQRKTRFSFESLEARRLLAADVASNDWIDPATAPPIESGVTGVDQWRMGPFQQQVLLNSADLDAPAQQTTGFETVLNNGPSDNRVDIVILGDGYTAAQIDNVYLSHVNGMLEYLFNAGQDPYPRYANFFNAHRINVISNESGADEPPNGIFVDTALDAYYFCGGTERLICINNTKANAAKNEALAGAGFNAEMQFVSVNDSKYGGSGGSYAVFAGANGSANELALHEVAHSFNDLADEYGGSPLYTGGEPREVNVTTDPQGAKWQRWVGYDQPGIGTIGAYEGARYFNQGLYRPSNNSKMRSLGRPFDAVSREKIILDIYDLVDPVDDWLDNAQTIRDTAPELWVQAIDWQVQAVQWSVDGVEVPAATAGTFNLRDAGFGPGVYDVSARVYDPTDWVRHQRSTLEQTIGWTVEVLAPPEVQSVQINHGDSSRSLVTSVQVTFDSLVDVSASSFLLMPRGTQQSIALNVTSSTTTTGTVADLRFQPGEFVLQRQAAGLHSLLDGQYELKIIASAVTTTVGNDPMSADVLFGNQATDAFFRLFGDVDGDRDVDGQDYGRFGQTFLQGPTSGAFDARFDRDGDGDVDGQDYGQFGLRFLKTMPF
ncbi:M64 family metallopeptidase [Stieleria magnilauensis]|uniref:IgA Peptidase M64 n=1 Tax=Stieleria magnilauensis TaxID=2527963 RepID=A0ABX5Y2X9_9BACT|nr:IgA Peptidase M64 [Planctomycetes bacterium TBK1r]